MINAQNRGTKKIVTFSGEVQTNGLSGTISSISWQNKDVMVGLREMFNCTKDEHIEAIEVSDLGITVRISRKG